MARIFIDGFEHGDLGLWDANVDNLGIGGAVITGSYCLTGVAGSLNGSIYKSITPSSTVCVAARFFSPLTGIHNRYFWIQLLTSLDTPAVKVSGVLTSDGEWTITVSGGDATGEYVAPSNDTCHIQVMFVNVSASSKTVIVKVDNIERINCNFTASAGAQETTTSKLHIYLSRTDSTYISADDIVIDDANWPGAPLIYGLTPNADGTTNEWSPSTGVDNYAVVDEVPANSTDYVSSTTSGEIDLYEVTNLPNTDVWSINSVQVSAYAKTPGPPEDEYLQLGVRSGGSNHFGERQQLSTSFAQHSNIFENNPITAAAWTQDEVNSGEFGMKEVS